VRNNARIAHEVRDLFGGGTLAGLSEAQLLDRFLSRRDDLAFEAILSRHGPMVLDICRRVLRDPHDADDAFQATFLVLARKAASIRERGHLAPWLCRIAHRVSLRAGAENSRRRQREANAPTAISDAPSPAAPEVGFYRILYEELNRLPEKYRTPIVLCYLEGLSHTDAAAQLQWPVGTVKGRLARARDRLRERLQRRGVNSPAGLFAAGFAPELRAVPHRLVRATDDAARTLAWRLGGWSAVGSEPVVTLVKGVSRSMFFNPIRVFVLTLIALGLGTAGSMVAARQSRSEPNPTGAIESRFHAFQEARDRAQDKPPPSFRASATRFDLRFDDPQFDTNGAPAPSRALLRTYEPQRKRTKANAPAEAIAASDELTRAVEGRIVKALPVTKDSLLLAYMPDYAIGGVDNIGIENQGGGVRTLLSWQTVAAEDVAPANRRILLAMWARGTTLHQPVGPVLAFEVLDSWNELTTTWKSMPRYAEDPGATLEFAPGEGWKLFDITALVRDQIEAGRQNHGVLLRFLNEDHSGPNRTMSGYQFVSREATGDLAKRRPILLVVDPGTESGR
jgi:RNA polymerase sigma factor (sigma-70 family)